MQSHFQNIICSFNFLHEVVNLRLQAHFNKEGPTPVFNFPELTIVPDENPLHRFLVQHNTDLAEYTILLIALAPHLQPNFFESIIQSFLPNGGEFTEIGGTKSGNHRGMLPTGETALFILGGNDLQRRMEIQQMLLHGNLLKENILSIESVKEGEPVMSGRLFIAQEWLDKVIFSRETAIQFSNDFPAKKISTDMSWDDLVLNSYTHSQLNDIMIWVRHNAAIMQDEVFRKKVKPGYRALFCGPSGTGKTLTASLIGKHFNRDVYRIDISQIVSKYIGETEKNLEKIFKKAENKNWILFFDEADALFGKRTGVQSSHDKYANQEVSYLLQRIEDYPGLLILASNFKSNMDDAFLRRFNNIIQFSIPNSVERLMLWQKSLPLSFKTEPSVSLHDLSEKYELNGAAILNIVHYASLKCISKKDDFLRHVDILEAIRKEYRKEERSMTNK